MAVRLIGFDLDGTILTNDKRITEETREVLAQAAARGIILVPVTGRPFHGIPQALFEIPGIRYVISSNGATTFDRETRTAMRKRHISPQEGLRIYQTLQRTGRARGKTLPVIEYFLKGWGYHDPETERMIRSRFLHTPLWPYFRDSRVTVPSMEVFLQQADAGVEDISVMCADADEREAYLAPLVRTPGIRIVRPAEGDFEIGDRDGDKGLALEELAAHLRIPAADCMAIGDGDNDMGLLNSAGLSVAMGNACRKLKETAVYTAPDNAHDGAAEAIARFALA